MGQTPGCVHTFQGSLDPVPEAEDQPAASFIPCCSACVPMWGHGAPIALACALADTSHLLSRHMLTIEMLEG